MKKRKFGCESVIFSFISLLYEDTQSYISYIKCPPLKCGIAGVEYSFGIYSTI